MRNDFSDSRKTISVFVMLGLALLITSWTLARNAQPEAPIAPQNERSSAKPSQDKLAKKVSDALTKNRKLKGENILVESVEGGKVKLTGTLKDQSKRLIAVQVAAKVAGKENVVNALLAKCGAINCQSDQHCCNCMPKNPSACECVPDGTSCNDKK